MDIKRKIKEAGFTITEVAAKMPNGDSIGITQPAMSAIINGNPTINKLKDIAEIIGIPLSELVRDETCSPDFIALVKDGADYYHANSLSELEDVVSTIKSKEQK